MKLQNHPDYNPWYDSHPNTSNIFDRGAYKSYDFQSRIDKLNELYEKIGFPFHVSYHEFMPGWQGRLYQLDFERTVPITDELSEMNHYMPKGIQALDKIDIVRYLENMRYYAVYLYNYMNDKYRKSLPFSSEIKDDMPF